MGIFSGNCPVPAGATDYNMKGTAHKPMLLVALACTAATVAISISLIVAHLRRYRSPKEQRQIIRIAFSPAVFAIVSFFELYNYATAQYIDPIGDVYESFCLCALFLLYLQFAAPGGTFGPEMFEAVKDADEGTRLGFDWPQITWLFVFQYPVTELIATIILEVTEALDDFCSQSLSPQYGHLWQLLISSVGVGCAVGAILKYYGRMKAMMKVRRGLAKLVCFKLIVFVRFVQAWVFSILLQYKVIKTSTTLSYNDILYGLPALLTCVEMVLFAAAFWFAYSSTEYGSSSKPRNQPLSIPKAVVDAMNPYDLFAGIGRCFSLFLHLRRTGGFKEWQQMKRQAKADKKAKKQSKGGQGRYRTLDGMESLSQPTHTHGRADSQPEQELQTYGGGYGQGHDLYQPPSGSPPDHDDPSKTYLMADVQPARSTSPVPAWNGQRYDRSPSPAGRAPLQGRDMV
ncbi:hypothetical protein LTR36_007998 [Oleoguttula mirabilis]|uniref:DUF300-domain-containing protein n=1 Tax=Oleoguttula mirabilis TaxID=1507867 RepID=A0AAV9J8H5_9PEZI|nr:hypothetical protein LTR36_007998 [Oleoguttula mirabilis]